MFQANAVRIQAFRFINANHCVSRHDDFANYGCQKILQSRSQWPRGLLPSARWDRGFESRRGHGCLSLVSVCVVT
jgi:hypothetical protein